MKHAKTAYVSVTGQMIPESVISGKTENDHTPSFPRRILLNMHDQIMVLDLNEVIYLKSSSNYTIIKMSDGSRYTSSKHLKSYCKVIDNNPDFIRIHRSSLVNKNFVKAIFRNGHKIGMLMKDNEKLDVSAKKRDLILEELSK